MSSLETSAFCDVVARADSGITVAWQRSPGHTPRSLTETDRARIDGLVDELGRAEQTGRGVSGARSRLGRALFSLIDGPARALTRRLDDVAKSGATLSLTVRVTAPDGSLHDHPALSWRWELMANSREFLALMPNLSLSVQLGEQTTEAPRVLETESLRILFMAYAPRDTPPVLEFEREEEQMLDILDGWIQKGRADLRVLELGTLAELERAIKDPVTDDGAGPAAWHVVHLSGHGILTPEGPRLVMESDIGTATWATPDDVLHVLQQASRMPDLVLISSCYSAHSRGDIASFAAHLVAGGVPTVIGWVTPVTEAAANSAAAAIFQRLYAGDSPARAVAFARRGLAQGVLPKGVAGNDSWGTLHLITREASGFQLRLKPRSARDRPGGQTGRARVYRYLTEQGRMKVLERGFVGRRGPLQDLLRALRGETTGDERRAGALIVGAGGVGKSCLAARAIERRMQDFDDRAPLGVVIIGGVIDERQELEILEQFRYQALRWQDREAEAVLGVSPPGETSSMGAWALHGIGDSRRTAPEPAVRRVERLLVGPWSGRELIIVLDDFEKNLQQAPDADAALVPLAAEWLQMFSRVCRLEAVPKLLITSRSRFAMPPGEERALTEIELGPFEVRDVRKLWLRGHARELSGFSWDAWRTLADRLGGNALMLAQVRALVAGKTPDAVPQLEGEISEGYLRDIAFAESMRDIDPDVRRFVERACVYEWPVPESALVGLTDGLALDLETLTRVAGNRGLLESFESDITAVFARQRVHRVNPMVASELSLTDEERWHGVAAAFWREAVASENSFGCGLQAWKHALQARRQDIADRMAPLVHQYFEIKGYYELSCDQAKRHLDYFPDSIPGLNWAGLAAVSVGRPREGEPWLARAEVQARAQGNLPPELLVNRGSVLHDLGRDDEADELLKEAIALLSAHNQQRAQRILSEAYRTRAAITYGRSDLNTAKTYLDGAIANMNDIQSAADVVSLTGMRLQLVSVLRSRGDYKAAEREIESIQDFLKQSGLPEIPWTLSAIAFETAMIRYRLGDPRGAREALERAKEIDSKARGGDINMQHAATLHELGRLQLEGGENYAAYESLTRSLEIKRIVLDKKVHPDYVNNLSLLAQTQERLRDFEGARQSLEEALSISRTVYGTEEHVNTANGRLVLSQILYSLDDLEGAVQEAERARELFIRIYGTDSHPNVAQSWYKLASIELARKNFDNARDAAEKTLEIERHIFETDSHPDVATTMGLLSSIKAAAGELTEALELQERARDIYVEVLGSESDRRIGVSWLRIGRILQKMGELADAQRAFERAHETLVTAHETNKHRDIALVLQDLADVLAAQGEIEQSRKVEQQALRIQASLLALNDSSSPDSEPAPSWVLTARDFRVHETVRWRPEYVAALVGPNGSGKSTLLRMLATLQTIYQRGLATAIEKLGGAVGLRREGAADGEPVRLAIRLGDLSWQWHLAVEGASLHPHSGETLSYQGIVWARRPVRSPVWFLRGEEQRASDDRRSCLRMLHDREDHLDVLRPLVTLLEQLRVHELYDLAALRTGATLRQDATRLDTRGSNLYSVLHAWQTAPHRFDNAFSWVMDKMHLAFPDLVDTLEFDTVGNSLQARFYPPRSQRGITSGDSGFPMYLAADGLLIGLLHLTAVAGAPHGAIVAIDEVDNHLHPHAIRHLIAAMRERAEERELTVILTSHSPVVMNEFRSQREQLFVFESGRNPQPVRVTEIHEEEWLMQFYLGDLYDRMQFGAPRKIEPIPEED